MKTPICYKCGKKMPGQVPDETTEITCFACEFKGKKYDGVQDSK